MTRLYLVCTSHDPEQFSDVIAPTRAGIRGIRETISPAERGHYLTMIDRMGLAHVVERMSLYKRNLVEFFAEHPSCGYVLQDDEGFRYDAYRGLDSRQPKSPFVGRNKKSHQDFLELSGMSLRRPQLPSYLTNYNQYGSPTGRLRRDGQLRTAYHRSTRAPSYDDLVAAGEAMAMAGYMGGGFESDPAHTCIHLPNASEDERKTALAVKAKSVHDMVLNQPIYDIDCYRLEENDLVLLTNQSDEMENGLYVFNESARRLRRYSTVRREFTTYYVMEGMRWKGTYWGLKSATFPYNKTRSVMSKDQNRSIGDYDELLNLGDTSVLELDVLLIEQGLSIWKRKDVFQKLYKAKRKKSGTVYALVELVEKDIPYYKCNVIFAGREGVMTDFLPPRDGDGPYTLVIDGRLIQGEACTKITILPKEG